jgi:hypothetical protein
VFLQADYIGLGSGERLGGNNAAGSNSDFFYRNRGGLTGVKAGVDVLFLEGFIDFKQGFGSDGWHSAWVGFMAGIKLAFDINLVGENTVYVAADVGFGFGTAGAFDPPLSNANVSQKGPVGVGRIGLDHKLNRFFSLGVEFDMGYHFLLLSGAAVESASDKFVHGLHYAGLLNAKLALGL